MSIATICTVPIKIWFHAISHRLVTFFLPHDKFYTPNITVLDRVFIGMAANVYKPASCCVHKVNSMAISDCDYIIELIGTKMLTQMSKGNVCCENSWHNNFSQHTIDCATTHQLRTFYDDTGTWSHDEDQQDTSVQRGQWIENSCLRVR